MFIKQLNTQEISPLSNTFLFEVSNIPEEDQSLIKKLSLRALNMIYTYTNGRVLTDTDFEIYVDSDEIVEELRLPVRPLLDVASIKVYDRDNVESTVSTSDYYFVAGDHEIFFDNLPSQVREKRSMKITMSAGYNITNTPLDLLGALEQLTLFLYENRGDNTNTTEIPLSIRLLLDPYVIHRF